MSFMRRMAAMGLTVLMFLSGALAEQTVVVRRLAGEDTRVAVTMDDCYEPINIEKTLALCREYDVPITFFVVGRGLRERDADMWRRVIDAGCEVGNHTYNHASLGLLPPRQIDRQLRRCQQELDAVLGYHYPMQVMRPPFGNLSANGRGDVAEAILHSGVKRIVLWDVSETDPDKVMGKVQGGSILLFHANYKDVRCLETLIPALLDKGYALCTVSELLDMPPVATSTDLYVYDEDAPW